MQSDGFQVFYQTRAFRICTVSRLTKISQQGVECITVDPHKSISVELFDEKSNSYLVICFIHHNGLGADPIVEVVDDRDHDMNFIKRCKYKKVQRRAVKLMQQFDKEMRQ